MDSYQQVEITLDRDSIVRRGEASATHIPDDLIGMTVDHARAWAYALGWTLRDFSGPGEIVFTDDHARNRINIWADSAGTVTRAELF